MKGVAIILIFVIVAAEQICWSRSNSHDSNESFTDQLSENCMNVQFLGWRIVSRIEPAKYQVHGLIGPLPQSSNFCGNEPGSVCFEVSPSDGILITKKDNYLSEGIIRTPLWIYIEKDPAKQKLIELPLANGFKKKFQVVFESTSCQIYGVQLKGAKDLIQAINKSDIQSVEVFLNLE